MSPWAPLGCDSGSVSLFTMTLTVLRNSGHIPCRMSLTWNLFLFFFKLEISGHVIVMYLKSNSARRKGSFLGKEMLVYFLFGLPLAKISYRIMALICSKGGGILTPSGCLAVSGDVSNSCNWEKEGDTGLRPGLGGGGGRVGGQRCC